MYLHKALRAPDREQLLKAMQQEVHDHESMKHWELVPRSGLPPGTSANDASIPVKCTVGKPA
jgi:hypothetical protein